jgi:hypothetical protein
MLWNGVSVEWGGTNWGAEMAETSAEGFDALVKRWDKRINIGGGYVEKDVVFPGSYVTCFTFYIHL